MPSLCVCRCTSCVSVAFFRSPETEQEHQRLVTELETLRGESLSMKACDSCFHFETLITFSGGEPKSTDGAVDVDRIATLHRMIRSAELRLENKLEWSL